MANAEHPQVPQWLNVNWQHTLRALSPRSSGPSVQLLPQEAFSPARLAVISGSCLGSTSKLDVEALLAGFFNVLGITNQLLQLSLINVSCAFISFGTLLCKRFSLASSVKLDFGIAHRFYLFLIAIPQEVFSNEDYMAYWNFIGLWILNDR